MASSFIFDNVVKPLIAYAIDPIKRHVSYPFKYKSNIENLDKKATKLKETRDSRQHEVDEERRNGKSIENGVERWLRVADEITERIDGERILWEERAKEKCLGVGFCFPNLKIRYQLSKKAEEEASAVAELLQENSKFDRIAYRTVPQSKFVSGDDLSLQSRGSLVKEIKDALTVPDVNIIGVHGVGGVGKSTIVKQVAQQAKEEKLIRTVVMAAVTQTPDVQKIQGQLADMLGLKFEAEEGEWLKAGRLHDRLKQEETVLVVLDDLWEKIDFKTVGIPSKDEHKGCKLVLTSRDKDVLISGMGCQKDFGVDCLTEDEAWNLFKYMAGDNFEDPEVQSVAVDVAKKCACLPVAIVTVARALGNKGLSAWQNALQELRRPSIQNFKGVPSDIYSCIELSYKHIDTEELKLLFLLCSLIMGYSASIHNLLKNVMGLGLFPNVISIQEARIRMDALLQKLKESYLLLDNDSNEQFAMHDVVRDVAMSIAYRDYHVFAANKEAELDLLRKEMQNKATQIWSRCYVELLEDLTCPQLELLQIFNGEIDQQMRGDIFEGMQKLKVLNLTNFSFSMLPPSLRLLNNLQTLSLDQSVLRDITIIGELKNLEILSFVECNIEQLPVEISQLTKLKLLDLSDCSELKVIPQNVISKLCKLEELYMGNSFHQWHPVGSNNASIFELENLTHLSNLDIHIRDPRVMSKDMFSERLERYKIFIGDVWNWDGVYGTSRTLKLKLDTSTSPLEYGVQMLLKKTEDLYVLGLNGVKNVIYELDREGFPQLKHLHLQNSPEIQYIVDTMEEVQSDPFPVLESLVLDLLISLEKIYHGALETWSPFRKLKILEVENCNKLKNLFSFSVARCLSQLQNFKVTMCCNLEEIVFEEEEEFEVKNKAINVIEFTQLRSVALKSLQHFRNFCSIKKANYLSKTHSNSLATTTGSGEIVSEDALRYPIPLFNEKIVFPNLVDLELHSINIETLWHYGAFSIQNLQKLHVESCDGLKCIFSAAMVKSLLQLKHLSVCSCKDVEDIIVAEEGLREEEMMNELLFPQLDYIDLKFLPKLRRFCTGHPIDCPLLKRLRIVGCRNIDTFVSSFESANMTVSHESSEVNLEGNGHNSVQPLFNEKVAFPSLAAIEISSAGNVKKIWHNLLAEDSFCKLRSLRISFCDKLVIIFPPNLLRRFQRLEVLDIDSCDLVEEIFELQELCAEETRTSYAFQLKDLKLFCTRKLKHIWNKDPLGMLNFGNLHTVAVYFCDDLKNIFPFSIARDLPQLETLKIHHSGVEQIVETMEENGHEDPCFVFPRLRTLELVGLTKFRDFYSTKHTWNCPTLKSLEVAGDCGNVKVFGSKNHGKVHHNDTIQEPLFDFEKVISNLEELSLDGKGPTTSIIWSYQLPTKFRSKVKVLNLANFKGGSDPVPLGFLQRLQELETLSIKSCSLKKLFLHERAADDEEQKLALLPKMRNLIIFEVDANVSHLWEEDHWLVPVLQNLRTLKACFCRKFVNLVPSSASFQDLTILEVIGCENLSHLIASSTARSLRQLVKLSIGYSDMVKIVEQEDATEDEIIFSRLEYLELCSLRELTSFCSGNYTFNFPCLKEMVVESCRKMRFFSPGVVRTPKLPGVRWQRDLENKQCWNGNLDNTIRQMYIEMVGCDSFHTVSLSAFPHLKETWLTQPLLKSLINLSSLTVDECPSFSVAIPSNVLRVLSNLKTLIVSKCDSLEEVFDLGGLNAEAGLLPNLMELCLMDLPKLRHIWNKDPRGILDFKNLEKLRVHNCGSLRNMLTPSIVLGLVQLHMIEIKNCDMMEEVIREERYDDETATTASDKIIFPVLGKIIFESLSNLTCIYSGSGTLEFPSLETIRVHNCPKMKTFIYSLLREQHLDLVIKETEQMQGRPGHDIHTAPHFNYKCQVAIPNLKEMELEWKYIMEEIRHGRCRDDFLQNLKVLKLACFSEEYTVFPSRFLGRFSNLVKLSVSNAYFEEIVLQEETIGEESHDGVLPRLQELHLSKLPKLVHLSKEDELPCLAFQNLEILRVSECGNLKTLSPSAISFQCLTRLGITKCDGLIQLMTSSTAKFLVKLAELIVSECELIEGIVANKVNEAENEVIFQELTWLTLDRLPSLTSFYLGKCAFMFPSLYTVIVKDCPKMETFSQAFISTPKLDVVVLEVDDNEWNWEGDLNTSIQKMFTDMGHGMEQSRLSSSHQTTLGDGSTQAGKNKMHAASDEGLPSGDPPIMENPDTKKDLLPDFEPGIETQVLMEPEITQLDDNEQHQFFPTRVDVVETCIPVQVQTAPQTIEKGKVPQDQVVHAHSSIQESIEVPQGLATDDKQAPKLASASSTKTSTNKQLSSATAPNFESLFSNVEQLLNPNQASSSRSKLNSTLACETTQADGNVPTAVRERQAFEDLHVNGTSKSSKDVPPVVETILIPKEDRFKGVLREPEIIPSTQDFHATSYDKGEPQQDLATPACSTEKSSLVSHLALVEQASALTNVSPIKTLSSQDFTSRTAASGSSSSMQEDPTVDLGTRISLQIQKFPPATQMVILLEVDGNEWKWKGDLSTGIQKMFTDMGDGVEQSKLSSSHQAIIGNGSTQAAKNKMHAASDEGLASDYVPVTENPDTRKDLLPVVEPGIEYKVHGSHSVLKEPEITQILLSRYHEISDDTEDNAHDQFSPTQVDVVETCITMQVQTGSQTTEKGKLPQDRVVHDSSSTDQSLEVPECPVTNDKQAPKLSPASPTRKRTYEQLTSATASNFESQFSSVEQLLNPSPPSYSQSTLNSVLDPERQASEDLPRTSETRKDITTDEDAKQKDNQMDIDDLLAMLEENQAIVSRRLISTVSSPRTSSAEPEVDEKEVHEQIAIIEKVLASGPETLCFHTSMEVVKETLEFLCVNPVDHLLSSERMVIVKKLSAELDNITRKVRSFTEAQSDLNTLTETHRTMMVSSKELLDEIMALKEARTKANADIGKAKERVKRLEQQRVELKEVVAAYHENAAKESAKIAAKAREALDVQKQGKGLMEQIQFRYPNYRKTKKGLKAIHRKWDAWKASFGYTQPGKNELHGNGSTQDQTSPTPTASKAHLSPQVQMDTPATDMMDVDDLLAQVEENQALLNRGVISLESSPRSSSAEPEADEKEVHDRIAIVGKVLASGPETLYLHFSIEVVKEALEFLCVNPVEHLVSLERMEVVKKLSAGLDDIARKVRSFTEARSDLDTLKETHRTMVVSSKEMLDEIAVFKEGRAKADADIGETKERLDRLEQQVAELKEVIADYDENAAKESAKIAAKAREALDVQKQVKGVMEQIQSRHANYRKAKKELKAVHRAWDAWKASFGL